MPVLLKRLIPVFIVLGVVGLLVYQLTHQGQAECKVCVTFKGHRQCTTARGPTKETAQEEAHRSSCSQIAHGVTDSFACPQVEPDEVTCGRGL